MPISPSKTRILLTIDRELLAWVDAQAKAEYRDRNNWIIAQIKKTKEASPMKNNQMTAREFLAYAGVEDSEANLFALTRYTDSPIDFAHFPDANIPDGLAQNADEPAGFQEYLDRHGKSEEASPMFERNSEWTGYTITKSDTGFVVSFWSRIQGETDGAKYLYQFDDTFTPDTILEAQWNESMTYGEYLAGTIREQYKSAKETGYKTNIKCLVKGDRVN